MADGPFRDPRGRFYPHPQYWTHRWRIDINIDHGISPIEPSEENQGTWQIIRRAYYEIAAAPWWMVYLWTTGFCSVYAPNILFSISHIKSLQWCPGEKIKFLYISMYCTTTYQLRPIGEWPISVFQVSVCSTYFTAALLPHNANNSSYVDPYFVWRNILLLRYSCLFSYKHDFGNSKFVLWSSINQI